MTVCGSTRFFLGFGKPGGRRHAHLARRKLSCTSNVTWPRRFQYIVSYTRHQGRANLRRSVGLSLMGTRQMQLYICVYCIYIYILQMGTIRGYSVHKPRNISRDYPPTHCWLKCPFQGKQADPPLQPLKRWKTQTLGALETTLDNIRNRDHSVHRLSAVRALNLHRRRSTCVLLTSVKCKRS